MIIKIDLKKYHKKLNHLGNSLIKILIMSLSLGLSRIKILNRNIYNIKRLNIIDFYKISDIYMYIYFYI